MNSFFNFTNKVERLNDLSKASQFCDLCPRMCHRDKILTEANGNVNSKVLFIAEAPGRLGADRTGIPLYGDKTGDNFEKLLNTIGWYRKNIFITNSVLCNPRKNNGNNRTPTLEELRNCSTYLEMTINLISPIMIVTLGRLALEAINYIRPHNLLLKESIGEVHDWIGIKLMPLYHPGPRAMVHRSFSKQTADYINLSKYIHPLKGIKQQSKKPTSKIKPSFDKLSKLDQCILAILQSAKDITYFKLMKLIFLADLTAINQLGYSITGSIYLRQQEGPWNPKLMDVLKKLNNFEIICYFRGRSPHVKIGSNPRFELRLQKQEMEILAKIISKYSSMTNSQIKTITYITKPMKYILRQERKGKKMLNKPVIYKDGTIIDFEEVNNA